MVAELPLMAEAWVVAIPTVVVAEAEAGLVADRVGMVGCQLLLKGSSLTC